MLSALDSEEAINAVPRERLDERAPYEQDQQRDTLLCPGAPTVEQTTGPSALDPPDPEALLVRVFLGETTAQ